MEQAVIEAKGLVKKYGDLEAVAGIDLEVYGGEIFGFLGPNGAGKSTTISMLCTLLTPTAGIARVAGIDVVRDPAAVRQRIGLVFQDPSLDDQLTARENLEFHAFVYSVPAPDRRRRIDEMLNLLQLADRASSAVKTFSGGMKRRLEIARGMLHQPQVLFLDEPTIGLDPQTRKSIWTHLNELRDTKGVTIFMTTHYMDEAEYCDRIAIIDRGKIVALGTPDELKAMVGGDVVTITSTAPGAAAKEIEDMLGVKPARDNGTLRMEVPDGKAFVPRLVRELSAPVDTVTLRRPSLDDVFLKLTGRAIRDEEVSARDRNRAMASRWMGRRR
ncbi:MAG: ATP-binding cassette domain-containing protein [Chloroflexi bacterium]|nr:MAG: ABC transporter ATP-binding protein [Actinobacteria bacterium 13_2_20CM_2_66_6]TMB77505.1 MAG: ATP-binding cassette domain-containing protein [Chloroflexota bacterium]TMF76689.1 MAG: ATP-binding cassette domain-containing protein [Chloroflexota bacterium]TMF79330.1 MAG: ATP-binding cassette domain-containing protein [Chloroflexota bacterium]TMF94300.1 MAG: ATP-binding cassette domain-containing protein [Chloroflexota bacterium]